MLRLIALGPTNAEIGAQLFLSIRTVETHRAHIQQKHRRSSRAELVRYALDHGLLADDDPGQGLTSTLSASRSAGAQIAAELADPREVEANCSSLGAVHPNPPSRSAMKPSTETLIE